MTAPGAGGAFPTLNQAGLSPAVPLYAYQRRWFLDRTRFKIGMFSRQSGKTFTTTLEAVDDCFEGLAADQRRRWVILSRGERQAKEAMDEGVKRHAAAYQMGFEELTFDWKNEVGAVVGTAFEVRLPGGSRITALPANPDTARGFSSNVMLDEFAFHADSRRIWSALFPVISAGHKIRVVSTPNGKGNKFFELMTGKDDGWSRHQVDIHQAVADGLPRDIAALKAALNDDDAWAQEFELQWLDEASAWLPYDLIAAVEDPDAGRPEAYRGGPCWIGWDIARRRDLTVFWVLEQLGDILWTRELVEMKGATFAAQAAELDRLMRTYHVVRVAGDQTGMGEGPIEDAQGRWGSSVVEGVLLSGARPLTVATAAKQAFEDRKVRIPGHPVIRADLHKPKKVVGATGAPRIVADRDGAGHADRAWALFLALAAAAGGGWTAGYAPAFPTGMSGASPDRRGWRNARGDDIDPGGSARMGRRFAGRGTY